MAATMKPDGASSDPKHNVEGLHKLIRESADKFVQIKSQRQELNAQAGDIRKRLRDAGIQTNVFEHHLRLRELEEEAQEEWLKNQALIREALPIGTQFNLLSEGEGGQPEDIAEARRAAKEAGHAAGLEGKDAGANPHVKTDPLNGVWQSGWMEAQRQRAEEMAPKGAAKEPAKKKAQGGKKPTASATGPADVVGPSPLSTASKAGRAAAQAGEPIDANPHPKDSQAHEYWDASWKSYAKTHPAMTTAPTQPEPPAAA